MVLESVKVSNFKSIGTMNNVLYVEDAITALIGKNESGKSNVLEAIGRMKPLTLPLNATYVKMLTRGQDEQPKVSLVFHFSPKVHVGILMIFQMLFSKSLVLFQIV